MPRENTQETQATKMIQNYVFYTTHDQAENCNPFNLNCDAGHHIIANIGLAYSSLL